MAGQEESHKMIGNFKSAFAVEAAVHHVAAVSPQGTGSPSSHAIMGSALGNGACI